MELQTKTTAPTGADKRTSEGGKQMRRVALTKTGAALTDEAKARRMKLGTLATILGISEQALWEMRTGRSDFRHQDILRIAHIWGREAAIKIFLPQASGRPEN